MKKLFDAKSAPFIYSLITLLLVVFASIGVKFSEPVDELANNISTSLQGGSYFAILGVFATSLLFPLYNHFWVNKGGFSLKAIFSKVSTWVSLWNAMFAGLAIFGFTLDDVQGTFDQVLIAVQTKDWMGLASILFLTVGNSLIRFIKEKNKS